MEDQFSGEGVCGSKVVRPRCPCAHCMRLRRQTKDDMSKHLWQYGYMLNYEPLVDFSQYERDRAEVMRQRIDGIEEDGIINLLEDFRNADMPDSPPLQEEPEEPGELEESEATAK